MIELRPTTNLKIPSNLVMNRSDNNRGFLAFYQGSFGSMYVPIFWLRAAFGGIMPVLSLKSFGSNRAQVKKVTNDVLSKRPIGLMALKKSPDDSDPYFQVTIPLFMFDPRGLENLLSSLFPAKALGDALEDLRNAPVLTPEFKVTGAQAIRNVQATGALRTAMEDSLLSIDAVELNGFIVIQAHLIIEVSEAEQLVATPYAEMRTSDLYGLLMNWGHGYYSAFTKTPKISFPITKIAASLPKSTLVKPRCNEDGITTTAEGRPYLVPVKLNQANRYAELFHTAGVRPGGDFQLLHPEDNAETRKLRKLPANMPVLVDWQNSRYSYTGPNGMMQSEDLTQARVPTATHITRWLESQVDIQAIQSFRNMATEMGLPDFKPAERYLSALSPAVQNSASRMLPDRYITDLSPWFVNQTGRENPRWLDLLGGEFLPYGAIGDWLNELAIALLENIEAIYNRYTVEYVANKLPWLIILALYGPKHQEYALEDRTSRQDYQEQGVEEDWQDESLPLIGSKLGQLPHQLRIRNVLRKAPKNAILPVPAGGGKCLVGSTLVTTDKGIIRLDDLFHDFGGMKHRVEGFRYPKEPIKVISTGGVYQDVQMLFTRQGDISTVELADGTVFEGIDEHRFWTQTGWKHIRDLDTNDYILRVPQAEFPKQSYKFAKGDYHLTATGRLRDSVSTLPTHMDKGLAFVLGGLVAEGSAGVFCNTDEAFVEKYVSAMRHVFKAEPKISIERRHGKKPLHYVAPPDAQALDFLIDIIGYRTTSAYQVVPRCVTASTKEHQRQFLRAYFEGDGDVGRRANCYSISKELIDMVALMLRNFGFNPQMESSQRRRKEWLTTNGEDEETLHTCYVAYIGMHELERFSKEIGFASRKQAILEDVVAAHAQFDVQGSNDSTQHWSNKVPAAEAVQELIQIIEDTVDLIAPQNPRAMYPIKFRQRVTQVLGRSDYTNRIWRAETRYSVEDLLHVIDHSDLAQELSYNERAQELLEEIGEILANTWCRVVDVQHNVRTEQVYDMTLPTTRAYVANGYLSHNTPLIIMDIIKFVKANRAFPYLVMCPGHLVAQYVKEVAYFTEGKMNAIPINTETLSNNGLERVTRIVQAAPRNTIVVVDYDVVSRTNVDTIVYGTTVVKVFQVVEFLRQFDFKYVALDESHYIKNDSNRTDAVRSLIVDIEYKRLASGTMAHESASDIAMQLGMFDPTIFGTRTDFNAKYGAEVRGNRVVRWRQGAELEIRRRIRENVVEARANRKEWAALLPPSKENLHVVRLSPLQQQVYDSILHGVLEEIEKEAAKSNNKTLKQFVSGKETTGEGEDGDDDAPMDDGALEALLRPYLARLERFLTAMDTDPLGEELLHGNELISPKVTKIGDIVREHMNAGIPGKIVVFCNYVASAEAIYTNLPPDIKKRFLLYRAEEKVATMAQFERPEIIGMVGVSASMDTGVNLQSASRLIREVTVWNPGSVEQGDARINRPQLKQEDRREFIYYDWIACQGTIDVPKLGRLYSKLVSVAKYENADNPLYATLEAPPVLTMNLDTIRTVNSFADPEIQECIDAFREYRTLRDQDYAEYRAKYREEHGGMLLIPVPHAENPPDAAVLAEVPYVSGLELPGQDVLGLTRLDQFLQSLKLELEVKQDEDLDTDVWLDEARQRLIGQQVHTELGEGVVYGLKSGSVVVEFAAGKRVTMAHATVFVMKRPIRVRANIANKAGLPLYSALKRQKERTSTGTQYNKAPKKRKVELDKDLSTTKPEKLVTSAEFFPIIVNGYLGIEYVPNIDENDEDADIYSDPIAGALQGFGFRSMPTYAAAEIKNHRQLLKQFQIWRDAGFTLDTGPGNVSLWFKDMWELLKQGKLHGHTAHIQYAKSNELRNFLREEFKPSGNKMKLRVYPLVMDGVPYIAMPFKGQSATMEAMKHKAPGLKFYKNHSLMQCFTGTIPNTLKLLGRISKSGIQVANAEEVKDTLRYYKPLKMRELDTPEFTL